MSLIYKCDRCKTATADEYDMYTIFLQDRRRNLDSSKADLCTQCYRAALQWLCNK